MGLYINELLKPESNSLQHRTYQDQSMPTFVRIYNNTIGARIYSLYANDCAIERN